MSQPTVQQALTVFVNAKSIKVNKHLVSIREYLKQNQTKEAILDLQERFLSIWMKFKEICGAMDYQNIIPVIQDAIDNNKKADKTISNHFVNELIKLCEYNEIRHNPHTTIGLGVGAAASTFMLTSLVLVIGSGSLVAIGGIVAFSALLAAIVLGVYMIGVVIVASITGETLPKLNEDENMSQLTSQPLANSDPAAKNTQQQPAAATIPGDKDLNSAAVEEDILPQKTAASVSLQANSEQLTFFPANIDSDINKNATVPVEPRALLV